MKSGIDKLTDTYYHPDEDIRQEGERTSTEEKSDRLLTVQEVCELLNVQKTYIYWLTHRKKIPYIKCRDI